MSSAKSRNFRRRRADDDVDEDDSSFATPSATKKPKPQPPKNLLSLADDEDESPFSRPPPSRSSASSRFSKSSSSHKLSSSKHRITPHHHPSSSNVQPQAGIYTKEALLELQKNTKTLAAPSRPAPGPVVVLKGLIKPVISNYLDPGATGEDLISNAATGDEIRKGDDDDEEMPDQATIEKIKAKRERLRQAKPAASDYIALDGGSNHGVAEGLSDEEPENLGRIGFFGEKIRVQEDTKDVFGDFEIKERRTGVVSDEEEDDEKMWEEEQVRKGLGGVGVISDNGVGNVRRSSVDSASGGGVNVDMFSTDAISISQQAELAKKALLENLKRVQESRGRTMMSLAKTEENLTQSLTNVSCLENALSAAGDKFVFVQKLREFVSVLCEFLKHKAPFVEELEEQMQKLREERARAITERRTADNDDEISEIEQALIEARAESANARALNIAPVETDEFGRDVNLQKRMDIKRRAEARQRRRAKSDSKRILAMENDGSAQQMEGELSTDESDGESAAYGSTRDQLLEVADKIFSDADEKFSQFSNVVERFENWKKDYASSYHDAYMSLSVPAVFSPYVRLELLKWDPLHEEADFMDMKWHSLLFNYGLPGEDASDANLVPQLVEKLAIPILRHQLAYCWDIFSTRETKNAVSAVNLVIGYVDLSSPALGELYTVIRDRLTDAVTDLIVPTWSPLEMKAVPNAARVAAYKFGTCVRLLRNICMWKSPFLEKVALQLLSGKILPHLHIIHSDIHDAITRTERVIASLCGVWAGFIDQRKLQPLVDHLLLIGKTLEKRNVSTAMQPETGELVRRLKKMLVELKENDHATALSRTFNIEEAL